MIVRLVNRFAVGLWGSHLFLGAFIGWWCSVIIPSWRSHGCAFCPHDISSPGLLCSAFVFRKASGVYFLCTTFARTCIAALCMCFIRPCPCVAAHVFGAKLGWGHVSVRSGDVSTASPQRFQSSVRTALLHVSSHSMTCVFLAEQTTSRFSQIRPLVLLQVPWSRACKCGLRKKLQLDQTLCTQDAFQVANTALQVHRVALGVVQISSMLIYFFHAVFGTCAAVSQRLFCTTCGSSSSSGNGSVVGIRRRNWFRVVQFQVSPMYFGFASTECPRGDRAAGSSAQRFAT